MAAAAGVLRGQHLDTAGWGTAHLDALKTCMTLLTSRELGCAACRLVRVTIVLVSGGWATGCAIHQHVKTAVQVPQVCNSNVNTTFFACYNRTCLNTPRLPSRKKRPPHSWGGGRNTHC